MPTSTVTIDHFTVSAMTEQIDIDALIEDCEDRASEMLEDGLSSYAQVLDRCADALRQQSEPPAEVAELRERDRWIPVSEKPEKERTYLCWHKAWGMELVLFYQNEFRPIGLLGDKPTHYKQRIAPPDSAEGES